MTSDDQTQRERAAAAAAWMAAREACAAVGDAGTASRSYGSWADAFEAAARRIRALPPPADAMAALAEVVRVAVQQEREANALIADAVADRYKGRTSLVSQGRCVGAQEVSLSIRARARRGSA